MAILSLFYLEPSGLVLASLHALKALLPSLALVGTAGNWNLLRKRMIYDLLL